jgi:hypothetical protein
MGNGTRIYAKDSNVVARKIAGEMVLVPIRHRTGDLQFIYNLNEVAGRIWELIDGQRTLEDITKIIVEEYDVEYAQATEDIRGFTAKLKEPGFIKDNTPVPDG